MTDESKPDPEENDDASREDAAPDQTGDHLARAVREAFRNGSEDARKAFEENMPKAKEDFAKGVHDVAYAVAYAASFSAALLKEVAPEPLADGVREGREAGERAARKVARERRGEETGGTPDCSDDSGPVPV
ncbi:MAG: hypothetical protein WD342_04050 [Verrucomicrobiales bacterium]